MPWCVPAAVPAHDGTCRSQICPRQRFEGADRTKSFPGIHIPFCVCDVLNAFLSSASIR